MLWSGCCIFALRTIFLCHQNFLSSFFHWKNGIRHKFYRANGLGCRGYTALEENITKNWALYTVQIFTYSYLTV
ncbi:hypothetical protein HDV63DRAFT_200342 [Trichoderma sp. SZMC 28014]